MLANEIRVNPALVLRLFCLNAPYQFTPILNLRSLIFRLTPFGWLHSATLAPYLWW